MTATKRFLVLLLVVASVGLAAPADAARCAPPRCVTVRVPTPRGVKIPDDRVRVLLPDGYGYGSVRYPVVYLLHGVGDTFESWTNNTDVVAFTKRFKVIVVMPDGGHGREAGWYSNWSDGSRHWETFHTNTLVKFIDRTYRTLGSRGRGIMGNSMGGFGTMSYAARHRGLYRAAASFSGAVDTMYGYPASGPAFHYMGQGAGGYSVGTPNERVWGSQAGNEDRWRAHNPTDRAKDLKTTWLYVATGNGAPGGPAADDPSKPHGYATETFIYQMNLDFMQALDDEGAKYGSDVHGGRHDWPYWERDLHRILPRMLRAIS